MLDGELLRTRVNSKTIGSELLIYGSCIMEEYPSILNEQSKITRLHTCMEENHMNMVAWKIQTMARAKGIKKLTVLTVDGSPHCVQLHYAAEDVRKIFPGVEIIHQVIARGKIARISRDAVNRSRHLAEL